VQFSVVTHTQQAITYKLTVGIGVSLVVKVDNRIFFDNQCRIKIDLYSPGTIDITTKFARRVWYLKQELEKFLQNKTEQQ
jgi:hypothetical protein